MTFFNAYLSDLNEKNSSKQVYDLFKEWGIKETETVDFQTFEKFYQTIVHRS